MARVLTNHNRNVAIEIKRGPKWTTLVLMGSEIMVDRVANPMVDRDWFQLDYPLNKAIDKFLNPTMSSTVLTDGARRELNALKKGAA